MATSAGIFICLFGTAKTMQRIHNAEELRQLLARSPASQSCDCGLGACAGWDSLTEERWPAAQMQQLATLRDPEIAEPTFNECHPDGTRYESPDAPVAVAFFPYNRCDIWHCSHCQRHLLRYTEFGGYYVDHRVRALSPSLTLLD
jgi:hypothetical protein